MNIALPGDKSITHRALALAALADGESTIVNPLAGADTRAMAGALRRLGARIMSLRGGGGTVRVMGVGPAGFRQPSVALHCGNSGTAARFLLGLLAGHDMRVCVTGDGSLRGRPMRRVTKPLSLMGAQFTELAGDGLPLEVYGGPLRPITHRSEVASAQVKTALLLAALVGRVEVSVVEPLKSRDHTERLLGALGVSIESDGTTSRLFPSDTIRAFALTIPGDPSSAAYLLGATLLGRRGPLKLKGVLVNPLRTGFVSVLQRMGAEIEICYVHEHMGELVGDISAHPSRLTGTDIMEDEIPSLIDEIPLLAVMAAGAKGKTTFRGVGELRVKESDRVMTLTTNLTRLGVSCKVVGDDLQVEGRVQPLSGMVDTGLDHRIAMAFAVAGSRPGASVQLSEDKSPRVSYPHFFDDLDRVISDL